MVRSPGTPHALHCYHAGWSHCHLEGINTQTSRTLSGWAKITSLPCFLVEVLLELLCFSSSIWPESKACFEWDAQLIASLFSFHLSVLLLNSNSWTHRTTRKPWDPSQCCSLSPKVPSLLIFCCLTLCVFLTLILCVISRLFSCAWQKEWNKCVYSSSWSQKVFLVGYIVWRQLAGFTDGLDVGCDRKDTEW